jgi:aminoglycoside phosphotransferase (APT) family kinase protein
MSLEERFSSHLASRYPAARSSNFNFLAKGFESELYAFNLQDSLSSEKQYILRLLTGKGAAEKLLREARGLTLLHKAGFPVPALLYQETDPEILGQPFEVIEKLEGRALWPVLASAEFHEVTHLLSKFGLLLARLHSLDWRSCIENADVYEKYPTLLLDETVSQYRSLYTKFGLKGFLRLLDWLDSHKHEISARPAIVHQDFHANNVLLCSDDQFFVIDWTQFAVSDYRIDLCWTVLIMGDLGNPEWKKQILTAYSSASNQPLPLGDLDYFNVIVYMKLLASTVISFLYTPQEVGLRPETRNITKEQASIYKRLSQRITRITGQSLPELEKIWEKT